MSETVGSILGLLRLDRSNWDEEIDGAKAKAAELGRSNPNVKISTNSGAAITQLAAVAAAVKRLQDAQGDESLAESKLATARGKAADVATRLQIAQNSEGVSTSKLTQLKQQLTRANTAASKAELDVDKAHRSVAVGVTQLAAAYETADKQTKKLTESSKSAKQGLTLMHTALVAGVPAAAALGVVGVGALAGIAGTAGVALAGILGVNSEIKRGTPLGHEYQAAFTPVVNEWQRLKSISAAGLFDGINKGIQTSKGLFPAVNQDAALFSHNLGLIAGNAGTGVVAVLHSLNPLFTTLGTQLVNGSQHFAQWATSSDSVSKFVSYVESNLPAAEHFLAELATTAGHVVQALIPLGTTGLSGLSLLLHLLNALPVGVLTTAVPLIASLALGIKAMNSASNAATGLSKLSGRLADAGGLAGKAAGVVGTASTAVRGLGVAGIAASVGLGVVTDIMGQQGQQAAANRAQIDSYTQALLASNLAIDSNVRATVAKKLSDDNSFYAGQRLGLSQKTLTDAVLGNRDALDQVNRAMDSGRAAVKNYEDNGIKPAGISAKDLQNSINRVNGSINGQVGAFKDARREAADQKAAIDGVTAAQNASQAATLRAASAIGLTSGAYLTAKQAADSNAASVRQTTANMIYASDAAGLLKQALDILNGKELNVSSATTQYDSTLLSLTKSLHDNGRTVAENTDKGVANRQAIEQSISAAQAQAQAVANATKSTERGTAAYNSSGAAILDHIAKQNGDRNAADRARDAAYQFAQQLLGIGRIKVPPTKFDVDKKTADDKMSTLKRNIETFPNGKKIQFNADTFGAISSVDRLRAVLASLPSNINIGASVNAAGQIGIKGGGKYAVGGLLRGAGSPTSDSIPLWGSDGEYMMQSAAVRKYGVKFFDTVNNLRAPVGPAMLNSTAVTNVDNSRTSTTTTGGTLRLVGPVTLTVDGKAMDGYIDGRVEQHTDQMADQLIYGRTG